jgi:hypothetical protein
LLQVAVSGSKASGPNLPTRFVLDCVSYQAERGTYVRRRVLSQLRSKQSPISTRTRVSGNRSLQRPAPPQEYEQQGNLRTGWELCSSRIGLIDVPIVLAFGQVGGRTFDAEYYPNYAQNQKRHCGRTQPRFTGDARTKHHFKIAHIAKHPQEPTLSQPHCFACLHRFPPCSRKCHSGGLPKTRRARGVKIPVHYIAFLALFFSGSPGSYGSRLQ